jgi:hypothetical protein
VVPLRKTPYNRLERRPKILPAKLPDVGASTEIG